MAGMNDVLELVVAQILFGASGSAPAGMTDFLGNRAWRIRWITTGGNTDNTNVESGTGLAYSTAGSVAIAQSELTVAQASGTTTVKVNTTKDASAGISTGETIARAVLEISIDDFSTVLGQVFSKDVYDADDAAITGVEVASGTILRCAANTGFVFTID